MAVQFNLYHGSNAEPSQSRNLDKYSIGSPERQNHADRPSLALWRLKEDDSCNAATPVSTFNLSEATCDLGQGFPAYVMITAP